MIPGMIAGGMGLGLGGSILGAYGQGQAAKSMADTRQHQLNEQMGIQRQGLQNAHAFVNDNNPSNSLATSFEAPNAIAQGELAKMGAAGNSIGLGTGNAGNSLASMQNANMSDQATQNQLAAPELAQRSHEFRLADLSNKQRALEDQAARRAQLYQQQLASAGMNGMGARTASGLIGLGGAGLTSAGMMMAPSPQGSLGTLGSTDIPGQPGNTYLNQARRGMPVMA